MKGPQNRDESIERLVRQSFQTPAGAAATDSCLDGETFAAWFDGGLSGPALEAAQSHVAGCTRCQATMGTLTRLNVIAAAGQAEQAPRRWLTWLVPIAAAAIVVGVWVAIPHEEINRTAGLTLPAREAERPFEAKTQVSAQPAAPTRQEPAAVAPTPPPLAAAKTEARTPEPRRDRAATEIDSLTKQIDSAPAASPPVAAPSAAPASSLNAQDSATASARLLAETIAVDIVSPDPAVRWRITGSTLQRSGDGGTTWQPIPIGTTAPLTAGVAPSPAVCWVVGRAGTVLTTTDGRSFRRITFPEITDLTSVHALDNRSASVSTADGRFFTTTDGGATWTPRRLQDF